MWIPCVRKYKIPIVVGVEVLVRPKLNFGTFAVLPDHVSLGIQAAEMVFDLMDNNWEINKSRVDPPLAVYKIINLQQAEKYFTVTEENLKSVDKILK
jgi:putative ABC transport system substrate-binding protein